jgi:hypothetical protein
MADPENHTLHRLRELRNDIKMMDENLERKIDQNHEEVTKRLDSLQRAIVGESILGRYATAEFEERLTAVEQRLSAIERRL